MTAPAFPSQPMSPDAPVTILRGWAKAYRDSPEHRFPSDPHAEFFPVDMEAAANRIEELETALRKSETVLGKIAAWLGRLATASEQRAKDNRFPSLADANAADAKNYRGTIVSIMPALEAARAALSPSTPAVSR